MNHELDALFTYDQNHWEHMFPISAYRMEKGRSPLTKSIVSPCDLAYNLQFRAEHQADLYGYTSVPTDIFVFGAGEPGRRDVTKINGLPYRQSRIQWPHTRNGKPFTFLAQFRFCESWDILGPLPGDVLLVFMKDEWPIFDDPEAFHFEWHGIDLDPSTLIQASEMPTPGWTFFKRFGVRHRTVDIPNTQSVYGDVMSRHLLATLKGTKIGGVSCNENIETPITGQFLCSLGSICCAIGTPYPWVNHPSMVSHSQAIEEQNSINFGDGGSLVFHIEGKGEIHWELSCN